MKKLTFGEIENIGNWKPYNSAWTIDRNLPNNKNGIQETYGKLLNSFLNNGKFETIQFQDGSMSNYIEFLCFERSVDNNYLQAVDVFINLCAPIATYGEVSFFKQKDSYGLTHPKPENLEQITSDKLKIVETEVKRILIENQVRIVSYSLLNEDLKPGLIITENLLEGDKMFNYLFQWID